jgi:hypothetical protein
MVIIVFTIIITNILGAVCYEKNKTETISRLAKISGNNRNVLIRGCPFSFLPL